MLRPHRCRLPRAPALAHTDAIVSLPPHRPERRDHDASPDVIVAAKCTPAAKARRTDARPHSRDVRLDGAYLAGVGEVDYGHQGRGAKAKGDEAGNRRGERGVGGGEMPLMHLRWLQKHW